MSSPDKFSIKYEGRNEGILRHPRLWNISFQWNLSQAATPNEKKDRHVLQETEDPTLESNMWIPWWWRKEIKNDRRPTGQSRLEWKNAGLQTGEPLSYLLCLREKKNCSISECVVKSLGINGYIKKLSKAKGSLTPGRTKSCSRKEM